MVDRYSRWQRVELPGTLPVLYLGSHNTRPIQWFSDFTPVQWPLSHASRRLHSLSRSHTIRARERARVSMRVNFQLAHIFFVPFCCLFVLPRSFRQSNYRLPLIFNYLLWPGLFFPQSLLAEVYRLICKRHVELVLGSWSYQLIKV